MINKDENDAALLWAEIYRLQSALEGPAGFATWKDAAVFERLRMAESERDALRFRFLADRAVFVAIDRESHTTALTVNRYPHAVEGLALSDAVDEAMKAEQ